MDKIVLTVEKIVKFVKILPVAINVLMTIWKHQEILVLAHLEAIKMALHAKFVTQAITLLIQAVSNVDTFAKIVMMTNNAKTVQKKI